VLTILAHRGNVHGPHPAAENRVSTIDTALRRGFGLETDIRRATGGTFYIAHDPTCEIAGLEAEQFCACFRQHPGAEIALNIKELGDEAALVRFLVDQSIDQQVFLFDMELIEPRPGETLSLFRKLHPTLRLAARVSDRDEPVERALAMTEASIIWLDEFDAPWCTREDVRRLKAAGRTVYVVSPDLHGAPLEASVERWNFFCSAGVDGICTDYADALAAHVREHFPGLEP
jgi:glycerophosphoryl diester phosphodiesterase